MCREYLKNLKASAGIEKFPKIKFLHGNLKKEEVAAVFTHPKVKMYVTATRGEGYGLPLVEAAASGLPIVATGWSGHLQFLDKEKFGCVDYNLVEIEESRVDNRVFKRGFKWAEPVETSFKRELRKVYKDYQNAKSKSRDMMKKVRSEFGKQNIK